MSLYLRARRLVKRFLARWARPTDAAGEPLIRLTGPDSQPNTNALRVLTRDIEAMKLNIKNFGYELARERYSRRAHGTSGNAPVKVGLRSKATTQSDIESPWLDYWCTRLKIEPLYHRKVWELCYVLQALWERGMLAESKRGLGFGCGQEPLPSLMAAHGVRVTATDLPLEMSVERGWKTGEHAGELGKLHFPDLVPREQFDALVELLYFDMNHIPDSLESKYDFCWSICAYEHLGSIEKGLRFVRESLKTLKPGGVAVHTTEFNFLNDKDTIDNWSTVLFQRKHFEQVAAELERSGHRVEPLDFDVGDGAIDRYIDIPPYGWDLKKPGPWFDAVDQRAHLKLNVDGFACTCFGLIVVKKGSEPGPAVG
jgi:2-polyprenyl-3-methyl-5-hydroxy-6-metoxy-1,4-benzoquinol methylase